MHEEKTFSRKDGLLVRSARESLANKVRHKLRINITNTFGSCSHVNYVSIEHIFSLKVPDLKVSTLFDYRQILLRRRQR